MNQILVSDSRSSSAVRFTSVNTVLVCLFYFCYYTEISITYNDVSIFPFFGCACVGAVILTINRLRITQADLTALGFIFFLYGLSVAVHLGDGEDVIRRLSSLANGCVVLLLGYCWCLALTSLPTDRIARLALAVAVFITVYAVLENFDLFRELSDSLRSVMYSRGVYDQDVRDIALYGAVRPKVFLREPSLVGINLGLSLSVWLLVRRQITLTNLLVVFVWIVGAIVAIRSPTLVFFAAVCVYGYAVYNLKRPEFVVFGGVLAILAVCMIPATSLAIADVFGGVFERVVTGWSFYVRQIGPYKIALTTLTADPLFGYGIGASQVLLREVQSTYASFAAVAGMGDFSQSVVVRPELYITNAFWQFWILFGLFSGLLLIYGFYRLLRVIGVRSVMFVVVSFCLVGQTLGGVTGLWISFVLFTYISVDVARQTT
ncbi:hypothetical protein ABH973_004006 [Bradyrhizobium ottawaense]|uniref:hypothetical protein n=1 Tax=Bradyrhizobium ottawaense TaxID=931866 RepID=UPI0035112ABF